jgi:hypothetical protein
MRLILLFIVLASFFALGPTCQQVREESSGLNLIVSDIPCDSVGEKIQQELKRLQIPIRKIDPTQGLIETGPIQNDPLPGEGYKKVEEQYRLEMKCREPLTTKITCQGVVKGLNPDNTWIQLPETGLYEKRFLEQLRIR